MRNRPPFAWWTLCLASLAARATAQESTHRPNIVLIVADDLGYGELGCYGQRKIEPPAVDDLALRAGDGPARRPRLRARQLRAADRGPARDPRRHAHAAAAAAAGGLRHG